MTTKVYDRVKGKWVVVNDVTTELTDISPIDSQHILGRNSAGNGPVESLAKTEVKSILGYLETEQDFADLIQAQSNIVSSYGDWLVPAVNGIYRTVDYITTPNLKTYVLTGLAISDVSGLTTALNNKQATLVNQTNIKSINGQSLLGSGDLTITVVLPPQTIIHQLRGINQDITVGINGDAGVVIPYDCEITGWKVLATSTGSIVVDVWKDNYTNYPPTVADSIAGASKPTLSSGIKASNLSLSPTWGLTAGDVVRFNVDSCTGLTSCTIILFILKV